MTTISNELELYSIKGNVSSGKIMLLSLLESRDKLSKDEIETKVVDEYEIMAPKHFKRSWKEYQKIKKYLFR